MIEAEHVAAMRAQLRRFVDQHMPRDQVAVWDRTDHFPRDVFAALAGPIGDRIELGGLDRDSVAELLRRNGSGALTDEQVDRVAERTDGNPTTRAATLKKIQTEMASTYLSTIPLLQGAQVAVARNGVSGVKDTLNASFQFRYSVLSKS